MSAARKSNATSREVCEIPATIHYATTCRECVAVHIGPALDRILAVDAVGYCGGCGRTVEKVRVAYWFPYAVTS